MPDREINWGLILLFVGVLAAYFGISIYIARRRKRRKPKKGFRTMKSHGQRIRDRKDRFQDPRP